MAGFDELDDDSMGVDDDLRRVFIKDSKWLRTEEELAAAFPMQRQAAYQWMQKNLKLSESDAHIAMLDLAGCEKLIKAVNRFLYPPSRFERDDVI